MIYLFDIYDRRVLLLSVRVLSSLTDRVDSADVPTGLDADSGCGLTVAGTVSSQLIPTRLSASQQQFSVCVKYVDQLSQSRASPLAKLMTSSIRSPLQSC